MICVKEAIHKMKIVLILIILFLGSCSSIRESAGVNRKSIDEYSVIENPPLIIPPDFNLSNTNQSKGKKIIDAETELAREILFGLDNNEISLPKKIGTMDKILSKAGGLDISNSIRDEIDRDFAQEIDTNKIFQVNFEDEVEVLDAIKESERIRNKKFDGTSIADGDVPIKKELRKKKKKKRFILF